MRADAEGWRVVRHMQRPTTSEACGDGEEGGTCFVPLISAANVQDRKFIVSLWSWSFACERPIVSGDLL